MDKRKSIKTAAAVLTAVALCVSSVAAYQRLGNTYVPSGQKRDLQTNQVLFPEDKDTQNSDSGTQEDESAYWEKDQSSDAQGRPQNSQRADYLFEDQQVPDAENQNSLTINKPNADTDTQPPQQSNAQQTTVQQPENGNTQTPATTSSRIRIMPISLSIILRRCRTRCRQTVATIITGTAIPPARIITAPTRAAPQQSRALRQTRRLFRSPQLHRMKRKNRSLPLLRLRHLHRVRQIPQRTLCS